MGLTTVSPEFLPQLSTFPIDLFSIKLKFNQCSISCCNEYCKKIIIIKLNDNNDTGNFYKSGQ